MDSEIIRVLLVEDNIEYAQLMRELLSLAVAVRYEVTHTITISEALQRLAEGSYHLILLDLFLPDCAGFDVFVKVRDQAPDTPVVVLTAREDESLPVQAVRYGAQDYLVKGQMNNKVLLRSIQYAIERQRGQDRIQYLTLIDELTGLYNRRGFLSYGKKYIKLAQRTMKSMQVLFADMDGLKNINDTLGHNNGDQALMDIAELFRKSFRESDIIGRIGGDEFAVLAMDIAASDGTTSLLVARLRENLEALNRLQTRAYRLSISVGISLFQPESHQTLEELLEDADAHMYEEKRLKKARQSSAVR